MLRTGIDLIEVERIDHLIISHGQRFLERVYTEQELRDSNGRTPSLAVRMAAKEAVSKVLGCGIGLVSWKDIEIIRLKGKPPTIQLHRKAAKRAQDLGISSIALSLSHSKEYAIASIVCESLNSNTLPIINKSK